MLGLLCAYFVMVEENYLPYSSVINVSRRSHQETETNHSVENYWKECRDKTNFNYISGNDTAS